MIRDRLTILGGSTPFSAALIDALVNADARIPPKNIVLFGRNQNNLQLLSDYGQHRLGGRGWKISHTTDITEALMGAGIVLHQIRYGDLEGRHLDEQIALGFDLPCDETLGPAALHRALCLAPELRRLSAVILETCPEAWIINLTNPLSVATAIMYDCGLRRCVGVCELPTVTARKAADIFDINLEEIDWAYAGLNHRGFVVRFEHDGEDIIGELAEKMGTATLGGIAGDVIDRLGAIPTKYFRLLTGAYPAQAGRAQFLLSLREQLLNELRADCTTPPPSLAHRNMEWYPQAVIPLLSAFSSATPTLQVVNLPSSGDSVSECRAWVSHEEVKLIPCAHVPEGAAHWLQVFQRHEQAMLKAVRSPSIETVLATMQVDPLVPEGISAPVGETIWRSYIESIQPEVS